MQKFVFIDFSKQQIITEASLGQPGANGSSPVPGSSMKSQERSHYRLRSSMKPILRRMTDRPAKGYQRSPQATACQREKWRWQYEAPWGVRSALAVLE